MLVFAGLAPRLAGGAEDGIDLRIEKIHRFGIARSSGEHGDLVFRGGLVLSGRRGFGGFSGLVVGADGTSIVAVGDTGTWLTGRMVLDEGGRLVGLAETRFFPRLGAGGRDITNKHEADAEALALRPNDRAPLLVAMERSSVLLAYPMPPDRDTVPKAVTMPSAIARVLEGHGTEALAVAPGGAEIFVALEDRSKSDGPDAWLLRGGHARPVALVRQADWAITGADFLPNGDLVIVERRFERPIWIGMRLRRFARQELHGPGPAVGTVLIEADLSDEIDNMEAVAAHQDEDGRLFFTLMSDDNHSMLQRTLLLRFELRDRLPKPRPNRGSLVR